MFSESEPSPKPEDLTCSDIQPWSSQLQKKKKSPKDYENDRVTKYSAYFKENEILPIPELVEAVEPKTLSFIVTDLRTRRLAGLKKEAFEELLKTAGIPGKYFYRRSFATWDVLLPTEEIAKKLARSNITTKYFRLQPEYRGQRRIKVTVCNVSMELNGDVIAAYLSSYGGGEDYTQITSAHGTAYGDFSFIMILDRGGFNAIPHTITYKNRTMAVIVEGRKPLCWNCKQLGHFSRSCPQKATTIATNKTTTATNDTNETNTEAKNSTHPEKESQPNKDEGWTLVKGGKGKKETKTKNKEKPEEMETTTNLKRKRDSGDTEKEGEKKQLKTNSPKPEKQKPQPLQPQQPAPQRPAEKQQPKRPEQNPKQPEKNTHPPPQRPAQISPTPQQPKSTPNKHPKTPLHPTLPSLSPISTPKQFTRSHSETRSPSPSPSTSQKKRTKSASNQFRQAVNGFYFCSDLMESPNLDHQLKKALKPLSSMKNIDQKDITNPYLFKGAAMVTTFVRLPGVRTKELWQFIEEASRTDIVLAEMGHPSHKDLLNKCTGRVPIYVHPCFYRSLKLRFPFDVGGISRDGRESTDLCTGSLRQAVGILTPKDFRPVVDTE